MNGIDKRIDEEKRTVNAMIRLFCQGKHGDVSLCNNCRKLLNYAFERLDKCPQASHKPTCSKCTIHCYSPEMRRQIRIVMRYAGPRMIFYHPLMVLRHLWREMRNH